MPEFFCPDETVCDCGHPRKLHSVSLRKKVPCMFRDPKTDKPCLCNFFTITLKNLPGRLTEEDIVSGSAGDKDPWLGSVATS